ncbi:MAG: uroporphyrinogen decarboxylase family protein [Promethearchaeia archaeon]
MCNITKDYDAWDIVQDALECKIPEQVPTFCLGGDWDFMERFYAEIGFTYEEFTQYKKDDLPWLCPVNIPLSVKLGIDLTWITSLGQMTWLDDYNEPGQMHGGRFKVANRLSSYTPPNEEEKMPIPHWWYLKPGLTTKEQIQEYMEKDIHYSKKEFKRYGKIIEVCEEKYNLVVSVGLTGPWENLHFGIGYANIAKFWRKDREFLHEIVDFYSNFALDGMKKLVKYAKPKVIMVGDDYGYNSGLQMSMEMWRELVKPTLVKHVQIAHEAGAKFLLHSCGNVGELFGEFVEIGIDGIESLKPFNNDLPALKRKYGEDIALVGTIDDSNLLKYATPEEVKESIAESLDALGPHGYIPGATNFLLDQPPDNILAMVEAIRNYQI